MKLIDTDIAKKHIKQSDLKNGEKIALLSCISSMPAADIDTLKPHPTEAIVLRIRYGEISREDAAELFNAVKSQFPENVVIAIPDYTNLRSCSKDVLENMITMLSEIIDNL